MVARPDLRAGGRVHDSENPHLSYFTARPQGRLSVAMGGCGVSPPLDGVRAYCETFAELKFVTNTQAPSLRIAIDVGSEFVVVVAGVSGVKLPVVELMV